MRRVRIGNLCVLAEIDPGEWAYEWTALEHEWGQPAMSPRPAENPEEITLSDLLPLPNVGQWIEAKLRDGRVIRGLVDHVGNSLKFHEVWLDFPHVEVGFINKGSSTNPHRSDILEWREAWT